ncbi:MAG TPA: hypothetical protein VHD81_09020 [Mycobacteriales bacterium]|nr:hypothetical protein [Mycobacteriales bacterium]
MAADWIETVLKSQLSSVRALIDEAAPTSWDPEPLRSLISEIITQINAATSDGTLTEEQGALAARLLADTLRAHPRVTTRQQSVSISSPVRLIPLDQPADPEPGAIAMTEANPDAVRQLFAAQTDQLHRAVAEGKLSAEAASNAIARLRESYGLPPDS